MLAEAVPRAVVVHQCGAGFPRLEVALDVDLQGLSRDDGRAAGIHPADDRAPQPRADAVIHRLAGGEAGPRVGVGEPVEAAGGAARASAMSSASSRCTTIVDAATIVGVADDRLDTEKISRGGSAETDDTDDAVRATGPCSP